LPARIEKLGSGSYVGFQNQKLKESNYTPNPHPISGEASKEKDSTSKSEASPSEIACGKDWELLGSW
jgi:hypothetical protein